MNNSANVPASVVSTSVSASARELANALAVPFGRVVVADDPEAMRSNAFALIGSIHLLIAELSLSTADDSGASAPPPETRVDAAGPPEVVPDLGDDEAAPRLQAVEAAVTGAETPATRNEAADDLPPAVPRLPETGPARPRVHNVIEPDEEKVPEQGDDDWFQPGRVYHSSQIMRGGTIVGVGPGYDGHTYTALGSGRTYDTRKPPPGPCVICGSREHWRKECSHAVGNRSIRHLF